MSVQTMKEEYELVEKQVAPFIESIEGVKIENNDDYIKYGEVYNSVKAQEKLIKTSKEAITKPLNESLKAARALFKPLEDKLAIAKTSLAKSLNDFKREQDRIAAEKARKLQEKIEKGTIKKPETIMKNMEKIEVAATAAAGLSETTRKVVDIDPSKMKAEYVHELIKRPSVWKAIEVEIRKDALGNKAQGIAPRIEDGITVREEKVVY